MHDVEDMPSEDTSTFSLEKDMVISPKKTMLSPYTYRKRVALRPGPLHDFWIMCAICTGVTYHVPITAHLRSYESYLLRICILDPTARQVIGNISIIKFDQP